MAATIIVLYFNNLSPSLLIHAFYACLECLQCLHKFCSKAPILMAQDTGFFHLDEWHYEENTPSDILIMVTGKKR